MKLNEVHRKDIAWLMAFAIGHVAIFAGLFRGVYSMTQSGTGLYFDYGNAILAGQVPYRDFLVEYPPFALVFFTVPRLVGASFRWYYVAYQTQVVLFDLIALGALYVARDRSRPPWWTLGAYTLAVLAVGPIMLQQYDVFPATFTLLAVVCYSRRRDTAAWIFLALGVMTKAYPLLIAPIFLLLDWQRGRRPRDFVRPAIVFATTCVVVLLPLLVIAPTSLERMLAFHAQRGIHLDSTYSSLSFVAESLGLTTIRIVYTFRSLNVAGTVPDMLAKLSTFVLGAFVLGAYAFIARCVRRLDVTRTSELEIIATAAALVLLVGLIGSKVLSPQYFIWVVPLVPLVAAPRWFAALGVFVLLGLVTYYIYPLHYQALLDRREFAIAVLALRNILLVALAVIVGSSLRAATHTNQTPNAHPHGF